MPTQKREIVIPADKAQGNGFTPPPGYVSKDVEDHRNELKGQAAWDQYYASRSVKSSSAAAEDASFYRQATQEAMNDPGSSSERDSRVAKYASRAAAESDIAVGRKKSIPSYKHGGVVRKTGPALLHEGEEVIPKEARHILGSAGEQLRAHEVHIRRTAEKGKYIAKHVLRDRDGNAPTDGQRGEAEYSLSSPDEMLDHLHRHMVADDEDEEG